MSIPKEPRQLMINVMYLVLTALLALNVSAEIFNAFDMVNEGLKTANKTLDNSNDKLPTVIKDGAKKKDELQKYADRVDVVRNLSKEGSNYISDLVDKLIDEGGDMSGQVDDGDYVLLNNGEKELRGKRNYDATTRIMVDEGKGEELKKKMIEYKEKMLDLIDPDDRKNFSLPIEIDEQKWTKSVNEKKNWADFTFGHMPIGATLPIFTKFQNDLKASEAAVLNYLASKVGTTTEVVFDEYRVVSAPKKTYLTRGETFETEIFLSAAAGNTNTGISVNVNGSPVSTNSDGIAKFSATAGTLGKKTYKASITVTNPVNNEKKTYTSDFEYEVGEKSVAISATKMNVFYMGVDNPIEVSAAGVNSNEIRVNIDNGSISRNSDGTYTVKVSGGAEANVSVSAPGMNASKKFRVKRIPNPAPRFTPSQGGGVMGDGQFKAYSALIAVLDQFDFDARCDITDYLLIRQARREDAEISPNQGARYNGKSSALVAKAQSGDTYLFKDIKARCPGDGASRPIGDVIVNIK